MPKVSIIIPNYNHKPFLQQRLDTVFNQTYQDFEVILLDDASTDGSEEILLSYKDHPKVSHVIINNVNSGTPFRQWEKGIILAKGTYIWIAESDDYCELNFLECLVKELEVNSIIVLAYCASNIIDDNGNNLGRHKWADALDKTRWSNYYINQGKNEINNYLRHRNTITNASSVLFKRLTILELSFPRNMRFCGDWYMWMQLLELGDIVYIPKTLNYFRRHVASTKTIKSYQLEINRFKEYFYIVKKYNSLFYRLRQRHKFNWILNELLTKTDKFKKIDLIRLSMPLDLFLLFALKYIKK